MTDGPPPRLHPVTFSPSGRTVLARDGASLLEAATAAGERLAAECGGRGACGRCLVTIAGGQVPERCVTGRDAGRPQALACRTPVHGPLTVVPAVAADLPRLAPRERSVGAAPLRDLAPFPMAAAPIAGPAGAGDLGVALDLGTTTLQLLLVRLADGVVVGEAGAYNPQIPRGADVVTRIVAAERGLAAELASSARAAVRALVDEAAVGAGLDASRVRAYVVAGNLTMIHLLLGVDPSGIRRVPAQPAALAFDPVPAAALGWPGASAAVHLVPAAGAWVGGDIVAGAVRAGLSRPACDLTLYVDLGTNGEIVLGGPDFALACACSAGPAFEGSGIRCGMRADRGAVDGGRIDPDAGTLEVSTIGGGPARGVCGSGLITLADALLRAGWIDRAGRVTGRLPGGLRVDGAHGTGVALAPRGKVALWERDLASLVRAKAAMFAGIRTLVASLGADAGRPGRVVVSGNFGRFLHLPAAVGIGLLPDLPLPAYGHVRNGSLEGAALALLSADFRAEMDAYLGRLTYVDLSELPGYMDELVAASFLPHTDPAALRL